MENLPPAGENVCHPAGVVEAGVVDGVVLGVVEGGVFTVLMASSFFWHPVRNRAGTRQTRPVSAQVVRKKWCFMVSSWECNDHDVILL